MFEITKNRKGQIGGPLNLVIGIVFSLFFMGILVFSFALAGGAMLEMEVEKNTSTVAIETINQTIVGAQSFSQFSPTLWIMAAVAALLTILIGAVGVYFIARR